MSVAISSLFNRYRDVAGYLSPVGTDFDYQVYIRQLDNGSREKLKPRELVEEAQALVGRALYRQEKKTLNTRLISLTTTTSFSGTRYIFNHRSQSTIRRIPNSV